MATWADIQRLASDLQRAQLSISAEKLSDANCVEVIGKLIESGAIDVVFTVDGKEYITKKHLLTELKLECGAAGGRIPFVDLATNLRIDLSAVRQGVQNLLKESDEYLVSQDELIAVEYIDDLCKKLNEMFADTGRLSILGLTQLWGVPIEFLNQYIFSEVGKKIHAQRDGDLLYTNEFVDAQYRKLQCALWAVTRSIKLANLFSYFDITQSLFFSLINKLSGENKLHGTILGSKNSLNSVYVSEVQERNAQEYIRNALLNQRVISIDTVRKLDLEPKVVKESIFADKPVNILKKTILMGDFYKELLSTIEEKLQNDSYCSFDAIFRDYPLIDSEDAHHIMEVGTKQASKGKEWVYNEGSPYSYFKSIVEKAVDGLDEYIKQKAVEDAPKIVLALKELNTATGAAKKPAKDDDDDWKVGAKGGKKKGPAGKKGGKKTGTNVEEASKDTSGIFVLPQDEVLTKLVELNVFPEELLSEIIDDAMPLVNAMYKKEVEAQFTAGSSKDQKQLIQEKQKKVKELYTSFCCFEQGTEIFTEGLKEDLRQALLKATGTDIAITVLSLYVDVPNNQQMTTKVRNECLASITDKNARNELTELFESLTDLTKFHDSVAKLDACNIFVKQPDKRSRAEFLANHIQHYKDLLNECDEPSRMLLLIIVLIIAIKCKVAVYATGKFVSKIAKELTDVCSEAKNPIPEDVIEKITEAMPLVVKMIQGKTDDDQTEHLNQLLNDLKAYVLA
uniref:E3 UFM1-protein ligase 1 homolog n=2 Tax=Panagrolaimus sp. JU765 TaxID=591449 RepID=A0AC34RDP2_9BILA